MITAVRGPWKLAGVFIAVIGALVLVATPLSARRTAEGGAYGEPMPCRTVIVSSSQHASDWADGTEFPGDERDRVDGCEEPARWRLLGTFVFLAAGFVLLTPGGVRMWRTKSAEATGALPSKLAVCAWIGSIVVVFGALLVGVAIGKHAGRPSSVALTRTADEVHVRYGIPQGFEREYPNDDGTFAFRWMPDIEQKGLVEVQILEIVDLRTGEVVYRDDIRYRGRDVNVAAWSSTTDVLLGYSGDVGTAVIGPGPDGAWRELDAEACVERDVVDELGDEVARRLPVCEAP
jgi:hypothetical protein